MKALFRLMAFGFAVLAFVLLVADGTAMIAAKTYGFTATGDIIARFADAGAMERWQGALSRIHPLVLAAANTIFAVPAVIVATMLAFICWLIGRRGEPELVVRPPR